MDFHLTKYEGLSHQNKHSFKWTSHTNTARSSNHHSDARYNTTLHIDFPKVQNHNFSMNLDRSKSYIENLNSSIEKYADFNPAAIVQYKRESKALESNRRFAHKRMSSEGEQVYQNKFGFTILRNTCIRGGADGARKLKQLSELKTKYINLPNPQESSKSKSLMKILSRMTNRTNLSVQKSIDSRKDMNFRLKLKSPSFMKQAMRVKIQRISRSLIKNQVNEFDLSNRESLSNRRMESNPFRSNSRKAKRQAKRKLSKHEQSVDSQGMFNIQPWNIQL